MHITMFLTWIFQNLHLFSLEISIKRKQANQVPFMEVIIDLGSNSRNSKKKNCIFFAYKRRYLNFINQMKELGVASNSILAFKFQIAQF